MIIALVGPHGAGKSTLGRMLAGALGITFHDEVGQRLAADPAHRPDGSTALDPQPAFDEAVFVEELARDLAWSEDEHRVVESWHPGNLAYASERSPLVAAAFLAAVRQQVARLPALVIPVQASAAALASRQHEAGEPAFFTTVGRRAELWARGLGLPVLAPVRTSSDTPEQSLRRTIRRLHQAGIIQQSRGE